MYDTKNISKFNQWLHEFQLASPLRTKIIYRMPICIIFMRYTRRKEKLCKTNKGSIRHLREYERHTFSCELLRVKYYIVME